MHQIENFFSIKAHAIQANANDTKGTAVDILRP